MCRSDSGADTRDSENTFPASLADEREKERRGNHAETGRSREEGKKKVKERKKGNEQKNGK